MQLAHDAIGQIGLTLWHVLPWLAGMGVVFGLLSHLMPCNPTGPWWKKHGLLTDLAYWVFVPLFTRYLRIWLTVCITIWLFHITDGEKIGAYYQFGHGPVARLPFWVQLVGYIVLTDFALYWIHRAFHRGMLWKYHAIHHATEELEWISASRFHPLNLALGTAAVDVVALLCGVSPLIFVITGPFNIITSCMVHANLNWTFGPLRYVLASPVFHRWHHEETVCDKNFAGTFSLWDVMFGTYHMPEGVLPQNYGIDDKAMPEGLMAQIVYPLLQPEAGSVATAAEPAA